MVIGTQGSGGVSWQVDTPGVMVVTLDRPPASALGLQGAWSRCALRVEAGKAANRSR